MKYSLLKLTLVVVVFMLSLNSYAQNTCNNLSVQVLGSGGPELTKNRASSSYLLWLDKKAVLLIDAGGGSSFRFGQSGAKWQDLKAVLFTHFHADHSGDFAAMIKASWFGDRVKDLPVYGPYANNFMPSTNQFLDRLLGQKSGAFKYLADMYDEDSSEYKLVPTTLSNNDKTQLIYNKKGLKIFAQKVEHGPIPAFAYIIKTCGKTIVFSGDTNGKGFENLHLHKTDLFIAHNAVSENAGQAAKSLHMTPSQIGKIANNLNTKKLILSHRMKRTLGKEKQTQAQIRKNYSNELDFADDLDVYLVK